jgi:O-antigen ligase
MLPVALIALAIIAAPALALGAIRWRRAIVMALPFLVTLNGLAIPLGVSSVRLDQLAACLLVVPMVAPVLTGARRSLRVDAVCWWLLAILVANVVASALHSPALSYSVVQCANLASVWVIYLLLINFLETREELEAFLGRVIWAGIAAITIGIIAYTLAIAGFDVGGAEVSQIAAERLTEAYGAYGTMVEPNILGSFAGAHLVLAVALLVGALSHEVAPTRLRAIRWLAVISTIGLVLSFTRAAWIGAIAALLGVGLFAARRLAGRIHVKRWLASLGALSLAAIALLSLPGTAGNLLRFKLLNLVNVATPTGISRLVTYAMALEQTAKHWFIGWGTYTFAPLVAEGADFQRFENWRNLWIGNYLLLALHDTGVVGLLLWIGLLWTILVRGLRATRDLATLDPSSGTRTAALTAAVASLLIPFLATTGFSLGYAWLLIGLLGAHCRLADATRTSPSPRPVSIPIGDRLQPLPADAS